MMHNRSGNPTQCTPRVRNKLPGSQRTTHTHRFSNLKEVSSPKDEHDKPAKQTRQRGSNGILPLPLHQNHFTMFGGRPTHWLSTSKLKLMLPYLDELRRLPVILYLVTLTIRHAARQGMRGFGCRQRPATRSKSGALHTSTSMQKKPANASRPALHKADCQKSNLARGRPPSSLEIPTAQAKNNTRIDFARHRIRIL